MSLINSFTSATAGNLNAKGATLNKSEYRSIFNENEYSFPDTLQGKYQRKGVLCGRMRS